MSLLQAASFPFASAGLAKTWVDFKVPSLNIEALIEAHRKNAAALTAVNQTAFDGLQALAQRQGDLITTTVGDCSRVTSDVLAAASSEEKAAKQADAVRHVYVSTVAGFQELSDIAIKANVAVIDILNARVAEAFDEFKALFAVPVAATATASVPSAAVAAGRAPVVEPAALHAVAKAVSVAPTAAVAEQAAVASVEPEPAVSAPMPAVSAPAPRTTRRPTSRR